MAREDFMIARSLASEHHGVVTRGLLLSNGVSEPVALGWLRAGQLDRIDDGVYALPGTSMRDPLHRCCAAVHAVHQAAHLTGTTALGLMGLWSTVPRRPRVIVAHGHYRAPTWVDVTSSRDLHAMDRTFLRGIPSVTVERAVVEAARMMRYDVLVNLVEEVVRVRASTPVALSATAERLCKRGRRGPRSVLAAIDGLAPAADMDHGAMGVRYLRLLREGGIPEPIPEVPVLVDGVWRRFDFGWIPVLVGAELDGSEWHDRPRQRDHDTRRQNGLVIGGWAPLVFRWNQLTHRPDEVVEHTMAVLRARCSEFGLPWPAFRQRCEELHARWQRGELDLRRATAVASPRR